MGGARHGTYRTGVGYGRRSCSNAPARPTRIRDFRSLYFDSTLDEAQEVPPNADIAGIDGTGTGALNFARTRFEFPLEIEGIDLAGGGARTT